MGGNTVKKAVMYGAGNIGRGFIGQLLFESGYGTVFIDVNDDIVNALNKRRSYPLRILAEDVSSDLLIENVSAINGKDVGRCAAAIAEAELMATAVGAGILPKIAPVIAAGLIQRHNLGGRPLDILVCENLKNAGIVFRDLIAKHLPNNVCEWFNGNVGLVDTSIGRMVPLQSPELLDGDPLRVCAEAYCTLPVDRDAFRSDVSDLRGMRRYSPFSYYVERKLYIHNMGHALAAYCGDYMGYEYIWQSIGDPKIKSVVGKAMYSSADMLALRYNSDRNELHAHVDDLMSRFANRRLTDTVYRVGRDLRRKLAPEDRMVCALRACASAGTDTGRILLGIALALRFTYNDLNMPAERILTEICHISKDEPVYESILGILYKANSGIEFTALLEGVDGND